MMMMMMIVIGYKTIIRPKLENHIMAWQDRTKAGAQLKSYQWDHVDKNNDGDDDESLLMIFIVTLMMLSSRQNLENQNDGKV